MKPGLVSFSALSQETIQMNCEFIWSSCQCLWSSRWLVWPQNGYSPRWLNPWGSHNVVTISAHSLATQVFVSILEFSIRDYYLFRIKSLPPDPTMWWLRRKVTLNPTPKSLSPNPTRVWPGRKVILGQNHSHSTAGKNRFMYQLSKWAVWYNL